MRAPIRPHLTSSGGNSVAGVLHPSRQSFRRPMRRGLPVLLFFLRVAPPPCSAAAPPPCCRCGSRRSIRNMSFSPTIHLPDFGGSPPAPPPRRQRAREKKIVRNRVAPSVGATPRKRVPSPPAATLSRILVNIIQGDTPTVATLPPPPRVARSQSLLRGTPPRSLRSLPRQGCSLPVNSGCPA